ncbi:unnamed protein product [Absidia cylindrospora]
MSRQSPSPSVHSLRNGTGRGGGDSFPLTGAAAAPMVYSPTPRVTGGELLGALVGTSLTVVDDSIYTFAGFDQYTDEVYNSLHKLTYSDHNECNWKRVIYTKGRPPAKRNDHSASLWGKDKLVIFGGSSEEEEKYHNDIAILDLTTMTWEHPTTFGNRPDGRVRHSATIHNNKLYISGGILSSIATSAATRGSSGGQGQHPDTLLVLDLTTWIWQDPVPFVRRTQHITFVYHNRLYLFGGLQEDMTRSNYLSFIDINPSNNSNQNGVTATASTSAGAMVTHLDIHSPLAPSLTAQRFLQICGDQLVIVVTPSISQLSSASNVASGVWTLSLESLQWKCQQLGAHFGSCHWHSFAMAEHGTRLYLFGTEEDLPDEYYSKVICLDLMELGIVPEPVPQLGADMGRLLSDSTALTKPDFTLRSGVDSDDGNLYVHRLILLARWRYFYKKAFELNGNLGDTLTLMQPLDTLRGFVHYLYNDQLYGDGDGDTELSLMVVCDLLVMAFEYGMDRLLKLCIRRLYAGMDVNSVCHVFHAAKQAQQYGLLHHALRYIFEHFGAVSHSDGFRHLPRDLFLQILDEMPKDAAIVAHGLFPLSSGNLSNGSAIMQRTHSNGSGTNIDYGFNRQQRRRHGMAIDDDNEDEELEDEDIDDDDDDDDDSDEVDDDDAMET